MKSGGAVADPALVPGAMSAAIDLAAGFDAVADNGAIAMGAARRHRVDRAFEAVEIHRAAGAGDLERLVVIVAADIAFGHRGSPWDRALSGKRRGQGRGSGGDSAAPRAKEKFHHEGTKSTKATKRTDLRALL